MDLSKLKSRKLWAAVIAAVLTVLGDGVGLSPDVTRGIIAIAASYIIGQGISDHGAAGGSQGA